MQRGDWMGRALAAEERISQLEAEKTQLEHQFMSQLQKIATSLSQLLEKTEQHASSR